jgi:hypothetical protein
MTVHVPDRFKAANAFWIGLAKIGLTPAAVLSQARLPLTVYDGKKNLVTTAQFSALWRAVGELSADPAAGLKIATQIDVGNRPPSTMAAYYARDYRDALTRLARFKQLCSPEELQIKGTSLRKRWVNCIRYDRRSVPSYSGTRVHVSPHTGANPAERDSRPLSSTVPKRRNIPQSGTTVLDTATLVPL